MKLREMAASKKEDNANAEKQKRFTIDDQMKINHIPFNLKSLRVSL